MEKVTKRRSQVDTTGVQEEKARSLRVLERGRFLYHLRN